MSARYAKLAIDTMTAPFSFLACRARINYKFNEDAVMKNTSELSLLLTPLFYVQKRSHSHRLLFVFEKKNESWVAGLEYGDESLAIVIQRYTVLVY